MSLYSFLDTLNKKSNFSREEWKNVIIVSLVLAFITSFDKWGTTTFDLWVGLGNYFVALIIAFVVVVIHHASQRVYGLAEGVTTRFEMWWYGMLIGIALALVTNGGLAFLGATSTVMLTDKRQRLGRFRRFASIYEFSFVALAGSLGVICFAAIMKTIDLALPLPGVFSAFIDLLFRFSLLFVFWNLLPIPPLDGIKIMYGSRHVYAFVVITVIVYVVLFSLFSIFSFIWALIGGALLWILYYKLAG